jgi:hypothetical protein
VVRANRSPKTPVVTAAPPTTFAICSSLTTSAPLSSARQELAIQRVTET